jgi:hypothetical protein
VLIIRENFQTPKARPAWAGTGFERWKLPEVQIS